MLNRSLTLLFAAFATAGLSTAFQLDPTSQIRSVRVTAFNAFAGSDIDEANAVGFGPFLEMVSVSIPSSTGDLGEGQATQESVILPTGCSASGSARARRIGSETTASSSSQCYLSFDIETDVRYTLKASLNATQDAEARFRLDSEDSTWGITGDAIATAGNSADYEITVSGVLQRGSYRLSATAESRFAYLPFAEAGSASFAVDLELAPVSASDCIASDNSTGQHSRLTAFGSPSLAENAFLLRVSELPPSVAGQFIYGQLQPSAPFGAGILCLGNPLLRFPTPSPADPAGFAFAPVPFDQSPFQSGAGAILPGSSWTFQYWHRDFDAGGPTWNTSDAVTVSFLP